MGQQQSPTMQSARRRQINEPKPKLQIETRIEHEGILKLKKIPFKNSVEIDLGETPFFLQNAEISLSDLLSSRLYTNRLFPQQDVEKLIQNVVFTLAFLESNNIFYKDICPQNIYYQSGSFKILPNQLIEISCYQIAYKQKRENQTNLQESAQFNGSFVLLSPQMIIALRCNQQKITDDDILQKSNVFIFGMILLEATTLLPSSQCYDTDNYDILDTVINQRLSMVQQHYSQKIVRIIANMIDYDYEERMNLKDLSIWINRELNEGKQSRLITNNLQKKQSSVKFNQKQHGILTKSRMVNSQVNKNSRTNQVYLNKEQCFDSNGSKQYNYLYSQQKQNNKIYLKDPCKMETQNWRKEKQPTIRKEHKYQDRQIYQHNYKDESRYDDHKKYLQQPESKMRVHENHTAKHRMNYKYYPPADNIEESYPNLNRLKHIQPQQHPIRDYKQKRGRTKQQTKQQDHSLLRIKQQIQKSRKLIQEFQKNEGIVGHSQYQY